MYLVLRVVDLAVFCTQQ